MGDRSRQLGYAFGSYGSGIQSLRLPAKGRVLALDRVKMGLHLNAQQASVALGTLAWKTGAHRVTDRNCSTWVARGAPPETMNRTRPPKASLNVLNRRLSRIGAACENLVRMWKGGPCGKMQHNQGHQNRAHSLCIGTGSRVSCQRTDWLTAEMLAKAVFGLLKPRAAGASQMEDMDLAPPGAAPGAHLVDRLAALDGPELPLVGQIEHEAHEPVLLLQLHHDAGLDALQNTGHSHKQRRLQGGHVIRQLLHVALQQTGSTPFLTHGNWLPHGS